MASLGKSVPSLLRQLISTQANQLRSVSTCSRLHGAESSKPPTTPPPPKKQAPSSQTKPPASVSAYKVPEYYSHNPMTFYDVEKEMMKSRLPQPSSKVVKK